MIDSLEWSHPGEPLRMHPTIRPADVPFITLINVTFVTQSHFEPLLAYLPNDLILGVENVHNQACLSVLLLSSLLGYNDVLLGSLPLRFSFLGSGFWFRHFGVRFMML